MSILVGIMVVTVSTIAAEWKLHPSFDRTPLRVIDTPENTYFLVHQQIYNKNIIGYDFPSLTLFEYQKKSPEKGIVPLCHSVSLSSADIRMADYSPKGDYLIVVYNDGDIDLIDKNKKLTHIDRLKRYSIPGMTLVNSVTFEASSGDAWIATDAGYMCIDAISLTVKDVKVLGSAITAINRFGTRLVAISNSEAYETDKEGVASISDFTKIPAITLPTVMMPLSDNCFGYIQGAAGSTRPLMSATLVDGAWKTVRLGSDNFYSQVANESLVSRYEANFIPNKDGYFCFSSSKAWQLTAPAGGEGATVISISLDQDPVSMGSWDFIDFWSYRDRGTFVRRKAEYTEPVSISGSAEWSDTGAPIRPVAPAAFIATYMDYSDRYGMLVINHGQERELKYDAPVNPSLLSALYDSKWKLHSQAYVMPQSVENDVTLRNTYNANINRFPLPDPSGIIVDPVNPDWICCGSMFGGFMFQDLSDIKKDVIRFGAGNDLFRQFPGFIESVPVQTWGTLSSFSPPVYDNEGVIWSFYNNVFEKSGSSPKATLKYINANTRSALMNSKIEELEGNDVWGTIVLSETDYADWCCKIVACRHENNKNKVVVCTGNYDGVIYILDHKGTLEDISDDELKVVSAVKNRFGMIRKYSNLNDLVEDPVTGDIILSTYGGIIKFKPQDKCQDDIINGDFSVCDKLSDGVVGSTEQINKVIFDDGGRMWIGTNNTGVICVSADRDNIEAHYSTSNSPLPSDCVYGLGWNPESRSLMISTKLGLAEVFPDINSVGKTNNDAYVVPQSVIPGYNGYVEIRNITQNQPVRILDSTDNEIRTFLGNVSNHIEWDLKDKSGTRVSAGKYYIVIGNGTPLELIVMSE